MVYKNEEEYLEDLALRSQLPQGFRSSSLPLEFFPGELPKKSLPMKMNLSLILADKPVTAFAGTFTRNAFPGHPVILCRSRMNNSSVRGILINNKIANVRAPGGLEDSEELLEELSNLNGDSPQDYFSSSTGVIGWKLPVKDMKKKIPQLVHDLDSGSCLPLAKGIMTTDAYPKIHSVSVGKGRIVAVAKGAGMIEPNMGTMLVFIMTDIVVPRASLQSFLEVAVDQSFNRISIDGDQSTSDMAILLSSSLVDGVGGEEFQEALNLVCRQMAEDIVRNGEGTSHVIRTRIHGAPSEQAATGIGKAVINSPLVKTAVYGNDPNVGRILAALGDYAGNHQIPLSAEKLSISIGGISVFSNGFFTIDQTKEAELSRYFKENSMKAEGKSFPEHDGFVDLSIDLNAGDFSAEVLGSDLSFEYVHENADYRS